jgi:D-xylose transport system ATP-binding protein
MPPEDAKDMSVLIEMRHISVSFGGLQAVDDVSLDLHAGEVMGLVGHNAAGKSTLMKVLSGAYSPDAGEIWIDGRRAAIASARDALGLGIETIYQNLALADNLDACANLFLGRELVSAGGLLDEAAMESATRRVMSRLNPAFAKFHAPVASLSGGQRQSVAIARAVHFEARVLIMDEPMAALGIEESRMVGELIRELKSRGLGIFLISHDIHDVFDLADRISVMRNGRLVGTVRTTEVSQEDVLGMIILGRMPAA